MFLGRVVRLICPSLLANAPFKGVVHNKGEDTNVIFYIRGSHKRWNTSVTIFTKSYTHVYSFLLEAWNIVESVFKHHQTYKQT